MEHGEIFKLWINWENVLLQLLWIKYLRSLKRKNKYTCFFLKSTRTFRNIWQITIQVKRKWKAYWDSNWKSGIRSISAIYIGKCELFALRTIHLTGKLPNPPQALHVTWALTKPVPAQCWHAIVRGEVKPNPLQSLHFTCSADKPVPLQCTHVTLSVLLALSAFFVIPISFELWFACIEKTVSDLSSSFG